MFRRCRAAKKNGSQCSIEVREDISGQRETGLCHVHCPTGVYQTQKKRRPVVMHPFPVDWMDEEDRRPDGDRLFDIGLLK